MEFCKYRCILPILPGEECERRVFPSRPGEGSILMVEVSISPWGWSPLLSSQVSSSLRGASASSALPTGRQSRLRRPGNTQEQTQETTPGNKWHREAWTALLPSQAQNLTLVSLCNTRHDDGEPPLGLRACFAFKENASQRKRISTHSAGMLNALAQLAIPSAGVRNRRRLDHPMCQESSHKADQRRPSVPRQIWFK